MKHPPLNTIPLVSIVVPTRDSGKTLVGCLASINRQTYPSIEKIVVDQHSTDDTKVIAEGHGAKVILVAPSKFYTPPSISRNIGARIASGKYILHVDSDMELPSNVVEECVTRCEAEGAGAIIMPEMDVCNGFWAKCKALERSMYIGDQHLQAPRFFDRMYFDAIGGYDPTISSGEDWDIHNRIRRVAKVSSIDTAIRHHIGRIDLTRQLEKKYNYGKTIGRYMARYRKHALRQLMPFRIYVRNRRLFAHSFHYGIGLVVLRTLEYFSAGLGSIINKLREYF